MNLFIGIIFKLCFLDISGSASFLLTVYLICPNVMVDGCRGKLVKWCMSGQYFGLSVVPPVHQRVFLYTGEQDLVGLQAGYTGDST